MYVIVTFVLVLFPIFISSNQRFSSLILFLISPRFFEWLSVNESFDPLTTGSDVASVIPLSKFDFVSSIIALS